jgi:hypothetical protein
MTNLGEISHILGIKVVKTQDGRMSLTQASYVNEKVKEFNLENSKEVETPECKQYIPKQGGENVLDAEQITNYRAIVGSLIYAATTTRPDIAHAVNMAARHMQSPTHTHLNLARRILKYLKGSADYGLVYGNSKVDGNTIKLTAYCDADWAGNKEDRKSTTGYCVFMNGNLISWNVKKQQTVALSSAEAELMSVCEVVKELKWMKMFFSELGFQTVTPMTVHCDNQAAIQISENDISHDRTKHIDIRHYFIRDEVNENQIKLQWTSTHNQFADIFTKPLGEQIFVRFRNALLESLDI